MKKNKTTFFMILFFFIGLLILLYPSISNYTNSKIQSKAIDRYEELIKKVDTKDYDDFFNEADNYNKKIAKSFNPFATYKLIKNTINIDSIKNEELFGYITIDKIRVQLPIYYGTSNKVMSSSVGIFEGSSLPVGGSGVHSVLSAHRGLPSSVLFTNLDKLEVGDTFVVKVFDRKMTYEVDRVVIVNPKETEYLKVENDKDYVTLMTCTPYGINSHRMLVRGHRIENLKSNNYVSTDAFKVDKLVVTPIVCLPIIFVWLIVIALKPINKNNDYIEKYVYLNKNNNSRIKPSNNFEENDYSIFEKYVYPKNI